MSALLKFLLDNLIGILGLIASGIAAFVATKTYLLELSLRRYKFRVEAKHAKNGSHITVTTTNIGAPCVIASIVAEIDTAKPLLLKRRTDLLEYGTPVDVAIDPETIQQIPVYVHGRIVITLTDVSQYVCESIPFGEMVQLKEDTISFAGIASPKRD